MVVRFQDKAHSTRGFFGALPSPSTPSPADSTPGRPVEVVACPGTTVGGIAGSGASAPSCHKPKNHLGLDIAGSTNSHQEKYQHLQQSLGWVQVPVQERCEKQ